LTRNQVSCQKDRGFESHPLRHRKLRRCRFFCSAFSVVRRQGRILTSESPQCGWIVPSA